MKFCTLSLLCLVPIVFFAQKESGSLQAYINPNRFFDYAEVYGGAKLDVSPDRLYYADFSFGTALQVANEHNALFLQLDKNANSLFQQGSSFGSNPFSALIYGYHRKIQLSTKSFETLVLGFRGIYSLQESQVPALSFQGADEFMLEARLETNRGLWSFFPYARAFYRAGFYYSDNGFDTLAPGVYLPKVLPNYTKAWGGEIGCQVNFQWSRRLALSAHMQYRYLHFFNYGRAWENSPEPFHVLPKARFLHFPQTELGIHFLVSDYFMVSASARAFIEVYTGLGWMEYDWMLQSQLALRLMLD